MTFDNQKSGQEFGGDGQSVSKVEELYFCLFLLIPVVNFSLSALFPADKCIPWLPGERASWFTLSLSFDISLLFPYGGKTLL